MTIYRGVGSSVSGRPIGFDDLDVRLAVVEPYIPSSVAGSVGYRNLIRNGNIIVDQRGSSVTATGMGPDGWKLSKGTAGVALTMNRAAVSTFNDTTVNGSNFPYALRTAIGTAASPAAGEANAISTAIEGINCFHLGFGSGAAKTLKLSFLVYCTKVGTFAVSVRNATPNRSYVTSFTVTQANTLQHVSITIPGDITGTWAIDSTVGMTINFDLGSGTNFETPVNVWTAGNYLTFSGATKLCSSVDTMWITAVQLEMGTEATPYEQIPYDLQLLRCLRYYEKAALMQIYSGNVTSGSTYYISVPFKVQKRTTSPTLAYTDVSNSSFPAGVPTTESVNENGFIARKVANATASAGYFQFSYTADAELI